MTERRDVTVEFIEGENHREVNMTIDWPAKLTFIHPTTETIDPTLPPIDIMHEYKLRNVSRGSLLGRRDKVVYMLVDSTIEGAYSDGD